MNIPLCHKCADGLFALNVDCRHKSQTFMGCKRDSRIDHWDKAKKLCPILPQAANANPAIQQSSCYIRMLPTEWCHMFGVQVVDPDGWRGSMKPDWETPITSDMFVERYNMSTTRIIDREKYQVWRHIFERKG